MFINVLLQAGVLLCGGHGPGGLCGVGYSDGLWKQDPLSAHTAPGAYYPQVTTTGPVSRHTAPNPMCKNWDLFYLQHSHTDKKVGFILLLFWPGSVLVTAEASAGPVPQICCDGVLESIIESSHRVPPELLSWHSVKAVCPHWLCLAS